jgi:hypothetical protein
MPLVLYETRKPDGTEWRDIATVRFADPPGSVVDTTYGRNDILLFSCMGPTSGVTRVFNPAFHDLSATEREILTSGELEPLCRIAHGESFELDIKVSGGQLYRARWTHYDRYIPGWTPHA